MKRLWYIMYNRESPRLDCEKKSANLLDTLPESQIEFKTKNYRSKDKIIISGSCTMLKTYNLLSSTVCLAIVVTKILCHDCRLNGIFYLWMNKADNNSAFNWFSQHHLKVSFWHEYKMFHWYSTIKLSLFKYFFHIGHSLTKIILNFVKLMTLSLAHFCL